MGKYENLRDNAFKLTLDAGGREFLEVKKGIGEYDDKIARRFPTMLRPVSKTELKQQTVVKEVEESVVEVEPAIDPEKVIVEEPVLIKESEDKPTKKKRGRKKGSKNKKKVDNVETKK